MNKANRRIYLSPPHLSEEGYELELVKEVFASNWIAPLGPQVDGFEREFAEYIGVKQAAALSSGTAALHLALQMVGVERGDTVLCSTFTFSASVNAIAYLDAVPHFIDCDSRTWNIDPELVAEELKRLAARRKLPKAVVAVDLYGQSVDFDPVIDACAEFEVPLIEDAAEALGASYKGKHTGRFGLISAFSFNGNKIITTSGGGMLTSDDTRFVEKARFLATQARDPAPHYQHSEIGNNYRLSNVLAAIGRGQLRVLESRVKRKREVFDYYHERLGVLPGIKFMPEPDGFQSTRWLTCAVIDPAEFGANRDQIRLALEISNIESRPLWKPMHLQPVFADFPATGGAVSEGLFQHGVCLPSGTTLTDEQLSLICEIVEEVRKG